MAEVTVFDDTIVFSVVGFDVDFGILLCLLFAGYMVGLCLAELEVDGTFVLFLDSVGVVLVVCVGGVGLGGLDFRSVIFFCSGWLESVNSGEVGLGSFELEVFALLFLVGILTVVLAMLDVGLVEGCVDTGVGLVLAMLDVVLVAGCVDTGLGLVLAMLDVVLVDGGDVADLSLVVAVVVVVEVVVGALVVAGSQ